MKMAGGAASIHECRSFLASIPNSLPRSLSDLAKSAAKPPSRHHFLARCGC